MFEALSATTLALAVLAMGAGTASANPADRVTVTPKDTGEALVNPDMGWTMHFYSNVPTNYGSQLAPSDTVDDFPGLSTVYLRIPWAYIEPEEGRFEWSILDTPAQRWIAKGKKIALRITCSENWMRFATPEWVKNAGAKGYFYDFGKGRSETGASWDPDFGDPIFLTKLDHFLKAMAVRYDGNPNVAFIDVGSYGLWGEGHTFFSSRVPEDQAFPILKKHMDLYARRFPHSLLVAVDDFAGPEKPGAHFPETDYALSLGMTLRDDSIMVQPPPKSWFHAEMAQAFWPKHPVIIEHEHYGGSKARGAWVPDKLLQAVEEYHASYMSIHWWPRIELEENRAAIDRVNLRMGYRLQLREMSWPAQVTIGRPFEIQMRWANAGVAPCYPGGFAALTLKDEKGGIVGVVVDDGLNMRSLGVGPDGQAPVTSRAFTSVLGRVAPTTAPGTYDVYVSVGQRDGTPRIALPLSDGDGQRRYRIGRIMLVAPK